MTVPAYLDDTDHDTYDSETSVDLSSPFIDTVRIHALDTPEAFAREKYEEVLSSLSSEPTPYLIATHHPELLHALVSRTALPLLTEVHVGAVVHSSEHGVGVLPHLSRTCAFIHVPTLRGPVTPEFRHALISSKVKWVVMGDPSSTTPLHPDWVFAMRDICVLNGISFTFAGWGSWVENATYHGRERTVRVPREVSNNHCAIRVNGDVALCPSQPRNPFLCGESGWTVMRRPNSTEEAMCIDGRLWDETPFDIIPFP